MTSPRNNAIDKNQLKTEVDKTASFGNKINDNQLYCKNNDNNYTTNYDNNINQKIKN